MLVGQNQHSASSLRYSQFATASSPKTLSCILWKLTRRTECTRENGCFFWIPGSSQENDSRGGRFLFPSLWCYVAMSIKHSGIYTFHNPSSLHSSRPFAISKIFQKLPPLGIYTLAVWQGTPFYLWLSWFSCYSPVLALSSHTDLYHVFASKQHPF